MKLYIKNMVCNRCITAVEQELERVGLKPLQVMLGEVTIDKDPTTKQLSPLQNNLLQLGFDLLDSPKKQEIEKIKNLIIQQVQSGTIEEHFSVSNYLSKALHKDYPQASRLFSEVEGITIEQFLILQKIEKVKEWLIYDELTLSEIAWKLGYSSVSHLSAQFKKVTGLTPTNFKANYPGTRKPLDKVYPNKI